MPNFKIPTELLLSFATAPLLAGLAGGRAIASLMQNLGQASEELFRGDRLPVLDRPVSPEEEKADV